MRYQGTSVFFEDRNSARRTPNHNGGAISRDVRFFSRTEIPRCEPPTTTEVDLSGGREVVPLGCVACDVGSHRDEVPRGPRKVYADMDPGLPSPSNSAVPSASDNAPGLETIVLSNPRLSSREPATSLVYVPSRGFTRLYSLSRA